jgi:hypothetical protein
VSRKILKNLNILKVNATKKGQSLLSCKFAVSPIFATLIILAVVTILFIPIFMWATGTSSQNEDYWESSGLIVTERVVIEEVNIKTSNECTIYVRNIGKTSVTIHNILIKLPNGVIQPFNSGQFTPTPQYVIQGELITIENVPIVYMAGVYEVNVITPKGVSDTFNVVVD